ncbi:hypothetical protein QBC33DRAFT_582207 [Phialemonium atrogriseum]|uniref:Uncharacterized protein n=1 Tax=Phialemonium atrogriseum TaxID=1093897 RepID=A0AAJ0BP19_9PEZI|nr:uncharacterized protein QBC33DRAFT_582207 [Phialemonium atrogriseum]KAK1761701.1 hypothetical protein QBC33DRAFT_582207 [Phialemonium atrogriseum]
MGLWGYTILRTVYTKESDALFPIAIGKLPSKMATDQKSNGSVNEELGRRFRVEVVEDKDKLNLPNLDDATFEDIKAFRRYFDQWVVALGEDPSTAEYSTSPRLCDFLLVDSASLRSLAALPDRTPPLCLAVDFAEKQGWQKDGSAHVWLVDCRAVGRYDEGNRSPERRGWMKLDTCNIQDCWLIRASRLDREDWMLGCAERPEGSGNYWYDDFF